MEISVDILIIKESCMYLSTQRFFKISHETKTPRKIHEKHIFQRSADLNLKFTFRCLPYGPHGANEQRKQ